MRKGLARLKDAVAAWTPATADRNRSEARKRLDWRHRLKVISHDLELTTPALEREASKLVCESPRPTEYPCRTLCPPGPKTRLEQ